MGETDDGRLQTFRSGTPDACSTVERYVHTRPEDMLVVFELCLRCLRDVQKMIIQD